jgi:signal transduction histidine kinase
VGRLGQLIDNLLANAVKFTPTGGRVDVGACPIDGGWRLEVTDTGIGVPADELGQLFQRFFRATNARRQANSGSRLGLAIARRVVELRQGTLRSRASKVQQGRGRVNRGPQPAPQARLGGPRDEPARSPRGFG